jgi:hypothetical protein
MFGRGSMVASRAVGRVIPVDSCGLRTYARGVDVTCSLVRQSVRNFAARALFKLFCMRGSWTFM